jgi:hypothetical protein
MLLKLLSVGLLGLVMLSVQIAHAELIPSEQTGLKYVLNENQKTDGDCAPVVLEGQCTTIKFIYPEFQGDKNQDSVAAINKSLLDRLRQMSDERPLPASLEMLMHQFIQDYRQSKQDYPQQPGWASETVVKVIQNSDRILSLEISGYRNTGGAHPNASTQYQNYNPKTGQEIRLSNLFKKGYRPLLNKIAEKRFRDVRSISPDASLDELGYWFDNNQFQVNDNFAIGEQGLIFIFNPYEIAPYALGPTQFEIPYRDLSSILRTNVR